MLEGCAVILTVMFRSLFSPSCVLHTWSQARSFTMALILQKSLDTAFARVLQSFPRRQFCSTAPSSRTWTLVAEFSRRFSTRLSRIARELLRSLLRLPMTATTTHAHPTA